MIIAFASNVKAVGDLQIPDQIYNIQQNFTIWGHYKIAGTPNGNVNSENCSVWVFNETAQLNIYTNNISVMNTSGLQGIYFKTYSNGTLKIGTYLVHIECIGGSGIATDDDSSGGLKIWEPIDADLFSVNNSLNNLIKTETSNILGNLSNNYTALIGILMVQTRVSFCILIMLIQQF